MTDYALIPCPSCSHEISADAEACPQCGCANSWVHPTLQKVISHLDTLPRVTRYEALGHRMSLHAEHYSFRQVVGELCMVASMVLLVLGLFSATFLSLALLSLGVGGALTLFGLSTSTTHELTIDLREERKVTSVSDERFWSDVIQLIT